jgi:hypothetical protein
MNIVGDDYVRTLISQDGYFIKLVFNARAAHFFPYTTEHRDASLPGMYYRDDSIGDALAATIKPTQIDVRLHRAFSPSQVKAILERIELSIGSNASSQPFNVNYGGKYLTTIKLNTYDNADSSHRADPSSKETATTNRWTEAVDQPLPDGKIYLPPLGHRWRSVTMKLLHVQRI